MTYYPDLSPCDYFDLTSTDPTRLLAVGWLEVGHDVPQGIAPPDARRRLASLVRNIWSPMIYMGGHSCSLCLGVSVRHAIDDVPSSYANMFVPAEDCVFASPELILHYVEAHGYAPPDQFWTAIERCPPMWSDRYFAALGRICPEEFREMLPPGIATGAGERARLEQDPATTSSALRPWSLLRDWQRKQRLWRRVNRCLRGVESKLGVGALAATAIVPNSSAGFVVTVRASLPIALPAPELAQKLEEALAGYEDSYLIADLRMPDA